MAEKIKLDPFAYDIAKRAVTKGEVFDDRAISQAIENILLTSRGERLFLLDFGSPLPDVLFENMSENDGEILLDNIIRAVEFWEPRVIILKDDAGMEFDDNTLKIYLPYIIKNTSVVSTFERTIIV